MLFYKKIVQIGKNMNRINVIQFFFSFLAFEQTCKNGKAKAFCLVSLFQDCLTYLGRL